MSFAFSQNTRKINWRQLAFVDIQKVINDVDLQILEDNLANISLCDIEEEISEYPVNRCFINLFKMAQLVIQYLMFTQQVLTNQVKVLTKKVKYMEQNDDAKTRSFNKNTSNVFSEERVQRPEMTEGRRAEIYKQDLQMNELRQKTGRADSEIKEHSVETKTQEMKENRLEIDERCPRIEGSRQEMRSPDLEMKEYSVETKTREMKENRLEMDGRCPRIEGSRQEMRRSDSEMKEYSVEINTRSSEIETHGSEIDRRGPQIKRLSREIRRSDPEIKTHMYSPEMKEHRLEIDKRSPQIKGLRENTERANSEMKGHCPESKEPCSEIDGNGPRIKGLCHKMVRPDPEIQEHIPEMKGHRLDIDGNGQQIKGLSREMRSPVPEMRAESLEVKKDGRPEKKERSNSNIEKQQKKEDDDRHQHVGRGINHVSMVQQEILQHVKRSKDSITSMAQKVDKIIFGNISGISPIRSTIDDDSSEINSMKTFDVYLLDTPGSFTTSSISTSSTVKRDLAEGIQRRRSLTKTV